MSEPLPRPVAFSLVHLATQLATHDGDDRRGALRVALEHILEARESTTHGEFLREVDEALKNLSADLDEEPPQSG